MPTEGSSSRSVIARKATTIGKVAGAAPPSYAQPVAAANSAIRSALTTYAGVGANVRPAREESTATVLPSAVVRRSRRTLPAVAARPAGDGSAGLAVHRVRPAAWAELLQLHAVRIVAPVLLGDVVAFLALGAGQGDLGADVAGLAGHGVPLLGRSYLCCVAGAGLEPATPRL